MGYETILKKYEESLSRRPIPEDFYGIDIANPYRDTSVFYVGTKWKAPYHWDSVPYGIPGLELYEKSLYIKKTRVMRY